jgi:5'-3' exonuclease
MKIHVVDGTYELFRAYYALPPFEAPDGRPVNAVRGLIQTLLQLLRQRDVTHVACAFDSGILSFRNDLFDGYKTGADTPEELRSQFELAEQAASALGIVTWPMIEFEADDAMATAAARWENAPDVEQVVICTPDKDLCQMVRGSRVVCLDRRKQVLLDEQGVVEKFGVQPRSIPDYLALVGDSADGIPGIPRWGAKSTAAVLSRYMHLEEIPTSAAVWDVAVRGAKTMATNLAQRREDATLYKTLATLRTDVPITETLDQLEWGGARATPYRSLCADLGFVRLSDAPAKWRQD